MTNLLYLIKEILNFSLDGECSISFENKQGQRYIFNGIEWDDWDDELQTNTTLVLKLRRMGE